MSLSSLFTASSPTLFPFQPKFYYQTIFLPSLTLQSLNRLAKIRLEKMLTNQSFLSMVTVKQKLLNLRPKLTKYLLAQKSPLWSFNYWSKKSQQTKKLPYPDDLDDTSCALEALYTYQPNLLDGKALANILQLFIVNEKQPGGPYKTWLINPQQKLNKPKTWEDIDFVVNCNIASFLQLFDAVPSKLTDFLTQQLLKNQINSPYYPSKTIALFSFAKAFENTSLSQSVKQKFSRLLKAEFKHQLGLKENFVASALNTALCFLAADYQKLNLDINSCQLQQFVLEMQQKNGLWPAEAVCLDPNLGGQQYYAGSELFSTAICLECLAKLQPKTKISKAKHCSNQNKLLAIIRQQTLNTFKPYDKIYPVVKKFIDKILTADSDREIALQAWHFKQSLPAKLQHKISLQLIKKLGIFNLLGWLAYTIYDHVQDRELPTSYINIANLAMRQLSQRLINLCSDNVALFKACNQLLAQMDISNFQELNWQAKTIKVAKTDKKILIIGLAKLKLLPEVYQNLFHLFNKSAGHLISPLICLNHLGYTTSHSMSQNFINFYQHTLVARQINDDAHDWKNDLLNQQPNWLHLKLFSSLKKTGSKHKTQCANKKNNSLVLTSSVLKTIEENFWETILPQVCQQIIKHCQLGTNNLAKCKFIAQTNYWQKLLDKQGKIAKKTIREQKMVKGIIEGIGCEPTTIHPFFVSK